MTFKAGYKIFPDMHFVVGCRFGDVNSSILLDYMRYLHKKNIYQDNYLFLIDTREQNYDMLLSELADYVRNLKNLEGVISPNIKVAGIYDSMHQLAYTQFIQKELEKVNQPMRFFTDMKLALEWLDVDLSLVDLEKLVEEIKKDPQYRYEE